MADKAGEKKSNNHSPLEDKTQEEQEDFRKQDTEAMDTSEGCEEGAPVPGTTDCNGDSGQENKEDIDMTPASDMGDLPPAMSDSQPQASQCYCGKGRNIGSVELQCNVCQGWFHSQCISCHIGKCIPFMTNYQFICKNCNQTGLESCQKKQASFTQICYTALANLVHTAESKGESKQVFSKDREIIPFIDKNWESLTTVSRRTKLTWHTTVFKTMTKEIDLFACDDSTGDFCFSLLTQDLSKIGPNSEVTRTSQLIGQLPKALPVVDSKGRTAKRKAPFDNQLIPGSKQKRSDQSSTAKLPPHGYPLEHPFNKDGYRYILAECDPHAPNRQAFDESLDWAGKPIPGYLYRTFLSSHVLLALHDRAPQLKVSDDRLSVTGEKGYSMIRSTHGVQCGRWYFEARITDMPPESAVRIGWSQSLGNLQAPCGYDKFSYSWRSRKGTRFHQSHGKHYSEDFGKGDVLGFYIHLPPPGDSGKLLPPTFKDRPLVKFKSHLYFEEKDYVTEAEKVLKESTSSEIIMYKNGRSQGIAYTDIFEGVYYPAVSIFKNATVKVNFGPKFKYPPKDIKFRPVSEAAQQAVVDYTLSDLIYHIENEGKLPEF
ncbi:set1/Ash2 histone methyltransferase complex subunit ASH2-like isoform X1 [Haliotis rufescens]|uniref:set1/Ash2 histone methyltransferase complex subunit ASH2-like isoform X1 n=1 Tax=Haliotis rufescens TaxID=6454 RepID=UPI00201EA80C|nr:set1/Ash2 histone methyltransferase complex subunit ASH2-like isoform X1 [Haliotis rufescens]